MPQKTGHKSKDGKNLFYNLEQRVVQKYVDKVPKWLETYHLTLLTILWTAGILIFSYLARNNINWLWLSSLIIFLQYVTDMFDGAVGRHRNTGLVLWGFYMDHLLDYFFISAVIIGYAMIFPAQYHFTFFFILAVIGAFSAHTHLAFGATQQFNISFGRIGPTEARLGCIILNTLIIFLGTATLEIALPYVLGIGMIIVFLAVLKEQKKIWKLDMDNKK
ncbi:MAG: CDP-alcohol phosphatidyltransferase family protein [Candidatus Woesearchaeota archaeon]|jgi:phosphatidylglycerophosphate synthase|nr:CDP-alcohol phosphatidyltransferase family protein [Candidatus Woesearchaeota archaeon]